MFGTNCYCHKLNLKSITIVSLMSYQRERIRILSNTWIEFNCEKLHHNLTTTALQSIIVTVDT